MPDSNIEIYPCSHAQRQLWFIEQLTPDVGLYNTSFVFRLKGKLDIVSLTAALKDLISRHETLRTGFKSDDGDPVQVVYAKVDPDIFIDDYSNLSGREQETRAMETIRSAISSPFDLQGKSQIRFSIIKLDENVFLFAVVIHHIVSDGWSNELIQKEISELYEMHLLGSSGPLPELGYKYHNYIEDSYKYFEGERSRRDWEYWRDCLRDAPTLDLPTDFARPFSQTHGGGHVSLPLAKEVVDDLNKLAIKNGATLFMVTLSVFFLLLSRYSRQDDIVLGYPIVGRTKEEHSGLIGMFVNILIARANLERNPDFLGFLKQTRDMCLQAYTHGSMPIEKLIQRLKPKRDPGRNPLYQVTFAFQNFPHHTFKLSGMDAEYVDIAAEKAKYDLSFSIHKYDDGYQIDVIYSTDLFADATIRRMTNHYKNMLQAITRKPESRIKEVPYLTQADTTLIREINTFRPGYKSGSIAQLFSDIASRYPEHVAVSHGTRQVTYAGLEHAANRVAANLLRYGISSGDRVALYFQRSIDLVIAQLGVLKTGACYVPLDYGVPHQRLIYIVNDARAKLLIEEHLELATAIGQEVDCLQFKDVARTQGSNAVSPPTIFGDADQCAYIIYTSGSTGRPKGVVVPHRGVCRLIGSTNYIALKPGSRVAQISNAAFDASTFEIWGALLNGARLEVFDREIVLSAQKFAAALRNRQIDTMFITTKLFHQLVDYDAAMFRDMQNLLVGGENLDPTRARQVLQAGAPANYLNVYGPTENTVFSTYFPITELDPKSNSVPIGRPISNTQVYILDDLQQPTAIGVPGEIYLAGEGLAKGYNNQNALTEQKFVFVQSYPGIRMYRSGDHGKLLADGNLEFLGRKDRQIKMRGYRIELDEVEQSIRELKGVSDVLVLERCESEDNYLLAYVIAEGDVSQSDLITDMRQHLPVYMQPAHVVVLDRWPLNANGKLDFDALPKPSFCAGPDTVEEDPLLQELQHIWGKILDVKHPATDANFFDLGGHSILSMRLLAEVKKKFDRDVPVVDFYNRPTIDALAEYIRKDEGGAEAPILVPIRKGSLQPTVFFFPGGGNSRRAVPARLLNGLAQALEPERPIYSVDAMEESARASHISLQELAPVLIQGIQEKQPKGPYILVGECIGGLIAWEVARQLVKEGQSIARLALLDTVLPTPERYQKHAQNRMRRMVRDLLGQIITLNKRIMYHARALAKTKEGRWKYIQEKRLKAKSLIGEMRSKQQYVKKKLKHKHAVLSYKPEPYPQDVYFLFSEELSQELVVESWRPYVGGQINTFPMKGNHYEHIRIYCDINAKVLANVLMQGDSDVDKIKVNYAQPSADVTAVL